MSDIRVIFWHMAWIAAKPLLDPLLAVIAIYGAFNWEWLLGGWGWVALLALAPGGHGYSMRQANGAQWWLLNPAHWQPLPAAPAATPTDGGEG